MPEYSAKSPHIGGFSVFCETYAPYTETSMHLTITSMPIFKYEPGQIAYIDGLRYVANAFGEIVTPDEKKKPQEPEAPKVPEPPAVDPVVPPITPPENPTGDVPASEGTEEGKEGTTETGDAPKGDEHPTETEGEGKPQESKTPEAPKTEPLAKKKAEQK